jgi:hypothetical protein
MKSLKISVVLSFLTALLAPAMLNAATSAQVVAEDPDGGLLIRSGSVSLLALGDLLKEGDVIKSNAATVVVSICDGALVTLYPNSEVAVSSLNDSAAVLNLVKGEILGDTLSGCTVSVTNKAGTTDISNGVYGLLLSESNEGWTLQVRNLDGNVNFTGGNNLDVSTATAAIVGPGSTVDVPAGDKLTVRGSYDADTNVFKLVTSSVGGMPDDVADRMGDVGKEMSGRRDMDTPPDAPVGPPDVLELPFDDIETASDKG